jgi:hypothetical protein
MHAPAASAAIAAASLVVAFALDAAIPRQAFASDTGPMALERAVGSWKGTGTARDTVAEKPDQVSCRATNSFTSDALKIAATCKSSTGEGQLVAFIRNGSKAETLGGIWYRNSTSLKAEERGDLVGGPAGGDKYALDVRAVGKTVAQVGLSFKGRNAMRLTVSAPPSDGGGVLLDVAFSR